MLILGKIILFIALLFIVIQDFKERQVYLWLFLLTGVTMALLHLNNSMIQLFLLNVGINLLIIFIIISVLYFYATIKMKKALQHTLGLGDILFFMVLAIGFTTGTFLVLLTFSLIFSLLFFLVIKSNLKYKTVPLAGLQALFISLVYIANWTFNFTNLYAI